MSRPTLKPGDLVADKYRIERLIGEGGMGVVFAARHLSLEQLVAIKILLPGVAGAQTVERFRREARAAARIRGEHVCRVLDVGELPDETPFMVMEYLEGSDLADVLERSGPLPVERVTGYVIQACEALAEAHQAGIVHRDLKPGNLFLAQRPSGLSIVKVLDFGVSKLMDGQASKAMSLTSTSMLVGSPLYMSPEQIDSARDVDAQTDVWALGVVLFELVTGKVPFTADTMPQFVHALLSKEPPTFASLGVRAPEGFEDVVRTALRKDKGERYASASALASALLPFAEDEARMSAQRAASFITGSLPAGVRSSQGEVEVRNSGVETPVQWERKDGSVTRAERRGALAMGLAALLLIGGGIVFWSDQDRASPGPETVGELGASEVDKSRNAIESASRTSLDEPLPVPTNDPVDASAPEPASPPDEPAPADMDDVESPSPAPTVERKPRPARARPPRAKVPETPSSQGITSPSAAPAVGAPRPANGPLLPDFGGRR